MKAEEIKILSGMDESINQYANAFDPCPLCRNKKDVYSEVCSICAYFYASHFEAKPLGNSEGGKNGNRNN